MEDKLIQEVEHLREFGHELSGLQIYNDPDNLLLVLNYARRRLAQELIDLMVVIREASQA